MTSAVTAISQVKPKPTPAKKTPPKLASAKPPAPKPGSQHLRDFLHITAEANVAFTFPAGFKETRILNNDDFSFDYAMEMPGHEFEIWLQVKSQKTNWQTYELSKNDPLKRTGNPDSTYLSVGSAQASGMADDTSYLTRRISSDVLARFNANAGKSYLITLPYQSATKRYKYALILTMEKDHIGTLMAVCFTNEKNPEFFKNVNRISRYIKFKP